MSEPRVNVPTSETVDLEKEQRRAELSLWVGQNVVRQTVELESGAETPKKKFEKRDYQLDSWIALEDARSEGQTKALLHLATGLGKTFVSAVDIMRYKEECARQTPPLEPRILYVSHQREINEQAAETFAQVMPDAEIGHFAPQKAKNDNRPEYDIEFATFQLLYSNLGKLDPQDYEYIIWDEGHHAEAKTYKRVIEHFDPLFELAITATPDRMDGKDIREYFGEAVYSKSLAEAIAEGHLANVDYNIVFDKAIKDKIADGFNPKTLKDIKELFNDKPPSEAIVKNIREEMTKLELEAPKAIIFAANIEEADEIAELMDGVAYHSNTKDRQGVLQDFREGRENIIVTRDMFNEGVDIPDAELIVFLRSTQSNNIFEQQLGRGLRRAPGKEKVYVLDFVANIERVAKIRELGKAIQRRAEEIDEAQDSVRADVTLSSEQNERPGLNIRSSHGKFDFDKIAVNLLEKWGALKENSALQIEVASLSNEELVVLALELKPDGPLTLREMDGLSKGRKFTSSASVSRRFGSISAFHRACGFYIGPRAKINEMSNEELVALALELKPDGPLTGKEIETFSKDERFVGHKTVAKRFGSLAVFQKACGFESTVSDGLVAKMSDDELAAFAKTLKPDAPLEIKEIRALTKDKRFVSYQTILRRFGSLAAFQKACGFDVKVKIGRNVTNEGIITLARQLKPEGLLSTADIEGLSKQGSFPSYPTILRRFGSLAAFQKACERADRQDEVDS